VGKYFQNIPMDTNEYPENQAGLQGIHLYIPFYFSEEKA
jgi:hypothetical protein